MCIEQHLPFACFLFRDPIFGHLDAGALAEHFQCFDEFKTVALNDKVDGIARFLAAETVEKLLFSIHMEGGRFLLVKRT